MTTPTLTLSFQQAGSMQRTVVSGPVILGRAPTCDISFPAEPKVSGRHARIEATAEGWTITDLNSRNGTFLNSRRISSEGLQDGDIILIGVVQIAVRLADAESAVAEAVWDKANPPSITGSVSLCGLEATSASTSSGIGSRLAKVPAGSVPAERRLSSLSLVQLFHQAGRHLLSSETFDDMLTKVLDLLFGTLPCQRGAVCLWDAATGELTTRVARTISDDCDRRIAVSRTIADDAIHSKRAVLVEDTNVDSRYAAVESVRALQIRSAMCAPLYHDGTVLGLIYLDTQAEERPFTAEDLEVLAAMAVFSAVGLQQAQLRDSVLREREIRAHLSRYSSPAVVDRIVAGPGADQGFAPEERDVTVLFADLCGFTTMSEAMTPADVAAVLNGIFERLTEVVFANEGTVDKFIGDGVMVVFGAPLPQADHALRAVRTALALQLALADYNAQHFSQAKISMRIGINSGPVVAGDIGAKMRRDYTVIGDTVNVASRLESSVARPGEVILGPRTHELVRAAFPCTPLAPVQLKGRQELVQPFRVDAAEPIEATLGARAGQTTEPLASPGSARSLS